MRALAGASLLVFGLLVALAAPGVTWFDGGELGAAGVTLQAPALSGSEDFAFMLERVPGSYLLIGNGDGSSPGACMVHNPGYDFNDDNIAIGAAYWFHAEGDKSGRRRRCVPLKALYLGREANEESVAEAIEKCIDHPVPPAI